MKQYLALSSFKAGTKIKNRHTIEYYNKLPCVLYPLTPHFYISKTGVYKGIHYFLIFALKLTLRVLFFEQKFENSK